MCARVRPLTLAHTHPSPAVALVFACTAFVACTAVVFFLSFRVVVFCLTRFIEHRRYGKTVVTGFELLRTSTLVSTVYIFEGDVKNLSRFWYKWFDTICWPCAGVAVLGLLGRELGVTPACYYLPPWVVVLTGVLSVVAASALVFSRYVFSNFVQSLADFLPLYQMMMHSLSTRGKKPATRGSTSPADDTRLSLLDGLHGLSRSRAGCSLLLGMAVNSISCTISPIYSASFTSIELVKIATSGLTCLLTFCTATMCAYTTAVSSNEESYLSVSLAAASVCVQLLFSEMLFRYCRARVKASWATCSSLINVAANGLTGLLTTCLVTAISKSADATPSAAASPLSAAASSSSSAFQIFVMMTSGETIVCNVEASYSIELVKRMIEVRAAALCAARARA